MFRAKKKHNRVRDWSNQHESRQWVLNEADTTTDQHDNVRECDVDANCCDLTPNLLPIIYS